MVTRSPNSNATGASGNSDPPDAADRQFQRLVARLHKLGARAVYEMLVEVGVQTMHMTTIEQVVARYAHLDPDAVSLFGGDRYPRHPDLRVVGGRNG